ncbi:unnamed protein product [Phytophthora lilii]|uniref:Unnamed protein product n=1 Tax=Phytophthora lilii TaxID=2077276 RepID=A0A9W6TBY8_9STRA|nr:unnamed protein product [Phytophthora lilii]
MTPDSLLVPIKYSEVNSLNASEAEGRKRAHEEALQVRHAVDLRVAVLLGDAIVDVDRAQAGRAAPLLTSGGALLRVVASEAREDEREQDREREDHEGANAPHGSGAKVLVHVAAHERRAGRAHALLHRRQQADHRALRALRRRLEHVVGEGSPEQAEGHAVQSLKGQPHPRVARERVDDHTDAIGHDAEDDAARRAEALEDLVGEEEERQLRDGLGGDDDTDEARVVARQVEVVQEEEVVDEAAHDASEQHHDVQHEHVRLVPDDGERLQVVGLGTLFVGLVGRDEAQQDEERDDGQAEHHVEAPGDADGGGHDAGEVAADAVAHGAVEPLLAVDAADVHEHGHGRLVQQRPRGLRLEVGHEEHDAHDVEGGHEAQREHEERGGDQAEDVHELLVLEHVGHAAPDGRRDDGAHAGQRQQDADLHLVEVLRVVEVDLREGTRALEDTTRGRPAAAATYGQVGLRGEGAVVDGEEELERHEPLALAAIDGELDEAQDRGHLGGGGRLARAGRIPM